jgi:hypothetical protein
MPNHRSRRYRHKQKSRRRAFKRGQMGGGLDPQEYRVFDNTPDDPWVATIPSQYRVKATNTMFAKDIGALSPDQKVRFFQDIIATNQWNDRHIFEARGTKGSSIYFEDGKIISVVST